MVGVDPSAATAAIDAVTAWVHIGLGAIEDLVTLPKAMRGRCGFTDVRLNQR
jgi:hypothetical protein